MYKVDTAVCRGLLSGMAGARQGAVSYRHGISRPTVKTAVSRFRAVTYQCRSVSIPSDASHSEFLIKGIREEAKHARYKDGRRRPACRKGTTIGLRRFGRMTSIIKYSWVRSPILTAKPLKSGRWRHAVCKLAAGRESRRPSSMKCCFIRS